MKHFLSLEPFDQPTLVELLDLADQMKRIADFPILHSRFLGKPGP